MCPYTLNQHSPQSRWYRRAMDSLKKHFIMFIFKEKNYLLLYKRKVDKIFCWRESWVSFKWGVVQRGLGMLLSATPVLHGKDLCLVCGYTCVLQLSLLPYPPTFPGLFLPEVLPEWQIGLPRPASFPMFPVSCNGINTPGIQT